MRLTYQDLKKQFLRNIGRTGSTDSDVIADLQSNMASRYQMILANMRGFTTQATQTASTVVGQQYYHLPPGVVMGDSATVIIGSVRYTITPIYSQTQWNVLNAIQIQPSAFPQFIFYRRDDFGIWPIPQGTYTVEFNYYLRDRSLLVDDYTDGTITVTNNSTTITGASTTFTAGMVGRWLEVTTTSHAGHGYWYRIASYTSGTVITLESAFEGSTGATLNYRIGECPEIPEEGHILLVDGPTADFYAGMRADIDKATWFNNKFWTGDGNNPNRDLGSDKIVGGLIGLMTRYSGRDDKRVIIERPSAYPPAYKIWSTTIS